jgi:hypothetical protein
MSFRFSSRRLKESPFEVWTGAESQAGCPDPLPVNNGLEITSSDLRDLDSKSTIP